MPNAFEENDILQVRLEGVNVTSGTRWNIVRYYRVLTNLDTEISHLEWLTGFAASIGVRFGLQVLTKLSEDLRYDFCRIQRIAPTDSVFAISADGADTGGVASGTDQPDAACLVTFRTDQPSKRFLGRCYIPGLPDAAVVDGLLTTQFAEEMWDAWTAMRTSHEVADVGEIELFHFSPKNFEQTDNVGQSAAPIISVEVDRIVRRQDRRDYKGRIPTTSGYTP